MSSTGSIRGNDCASDEGLKGAKISRLAYDRVLAALDWLLPYGFVVRALHKNLMPVWPCWSLGRLHPDRT